jgi:hypothetical protein
MKAKFRNVNFEMTRANGYGHYLLTGTYRGRVIKVQTTDSDAWDWLSDDSDKKKNNEARRRCYLKIVSQA